MRDSARLGYRPELDGIRGVAITLVVFRHVLGYPLGGGFGVDIFFVLSGFLITSLLLEEWRSTGHVRLRAFYLRRVLRLLPALLFLLVTYVPLETIRRLGVDDGANLSETITSALYGGFYVGNLRLALGSEFPAALSHLWSLATEEQFYVIWPILFIGILRFSGNLRTMFIAVGTLILAVATTRLLLSETGAPWRRLYYAPDMRADALLLGCLAGLLFTGFGDLLQRITASAWWKPVLLLASLGLGAIVMYPGPDRLLFAGGLTLFAGAVAVVILHVVSHERSRLGSLLRHPAAVFLGRISYSLYLWHVLARWFFDEMLGVDRTAVISGAILVVAVGTALFSYYFVEKPFLRLKHRLEPKFRKVDLAGISAEQVLATEPI